MQERARKERQPTHAVHAAAEHSTRNEITPDVIELPLHSIVPGPRRKVTTEDLAGVARTGSLDRLLEAVAAERLRDFETGKRPRPRTLAQRIFGVPDDATTRTRDALKDMTDTIDDATEMLKARGRFIAAGIELTTAQKRAILADAKLDTEIAQQAACKMRHEAVVQSARLEEAKLDTAIAEQVALKARHEAATRRAEDSDEVREMARRYRQELRKQARVARHEARRQAREVNASVRKRAAQAEEEVEKLRAQTRSLEANQEARAAVQQAEERSRAAVQSIIDELRVELEAARGRLAVQDDELGKAKRTLELERLKLQTQKAQHDQQVATAVLERRVQGALDPDGARRRRAEIHHRRELQRIADELQGFTNDAERLAYAKRESTAYVQRAADQYGENSNEHDAALSHAEEFMRDLLDKEEA